MKHLFSMAVALFMTATSFAQVVSEAISATLQRGESTTVYYGTDALKQALEDAEEGNIITLSSGTFSVPDNFNKSVKIYGAGYDDDTLTGVARTFLAGGVTMNGLDGQHPDYFYMEGVWINGNININNLETDTLIQGTKFVKCRMGTFNMKNNSDATILRQCFINGHIHGNNAVATGFIAQNCYITDRVQWFDTKSAVLIDHCILGAGWSSHGPYLYKNSIINDDHLTLDVGATVVNCIGGKGSLSNSDQNTLAHCYTDYSNLGDYLGTIFTDGQKNLNYTLDGTSIPRRWEIADPETLMADDSTAVGPAGGDYPWDKIPSTPRIISSKIGNKTVGGKLHVTVKAEARPVTE
ncbi:MAG: hypothetical protein J6T28_03505 [Paludibacteraceae bacterium]|nr:hypothetical protein [Paludibacteraceae bacterium]MBP5481465.1 hypothetical protein [Paludibacteraceae bacterium]